MRKLSLFAWTVIAVQIFFVYFMFQIGSSLGDCDEYVTDDGLAGVAGEIACEVVDEAMTLCFSTGSGLSGYSQISFSASLLFLAGKKS